MNDFNSFDDEELDGMIEDLIEDGYLVVTGYNENNEVLYQTTEKFKEDFPQFYEEQIKETNEVIFELWNMGLVDMTVKEEINDWVVIPNKKTFTCNLDYLDKRQKNLINYIRNKKQV